MSKNSTTKPKDKPNIILEGRLLSRPKYNLTLLSWNVQGVLNKIDYISLVSQDNNCNIMCLSEHWLTEAEIADLSVPGFTMASYFCRSKMSRGGCAILVKNCVKFEIYTNLPIVVEELTFEVTAILLSELKVVIVSFYRSPAGNINEFFNKLHDIFSLLHDTKLSIILAGDFNVDFLANSNEQRELQTLLDSFGLMVTVRDVTRPNFCRDSLGTCIDNIITNLHPDRWYSCVLHTVLSDHNAVLFEATLAASSKRSKPETPSPVTKTLSRKINAENLNLLEYYVKQLNWIDIYKNSNLSINDQFVIFFDLILRAVNSTMPLKLAVNKKRVGPPNLKWYHKGLAAMKIELDKLYFILKHSNRPTGNHSIRDRYLLLKKQYRSDIKNAKISANSNLIDSSKNKTKAAWAVIKNTLNSNSIPLPTHSFLSARKFNDFFVDSINKITNSVPPSVIDHKSYLSKSVIRSRNSRAVNNFIIHEFSVEQVYYAIHSLSSSACLDIYGLNATILKRISIYICEVLAYLFNMCVKQGVFPDILKANKVLPVHKKGPKEIYNNYRPISIIPAVAKVLERLVHAQLVEYLESSSLLSTSQYGFRPNHSTIEALQALITDCYEGLESQKNVIFRSYDMSKAFDTVAHSILIEKLSYYFCVPNTVNFFKSYLENRRQSVFLNGEFSGSLSVKHGVPQGSILGPTLFILYINDLPSNISDINVKCFLFADDLGICVKDKSKYSAVTTLGDKSSIITDWCNANKLSLNNDKIQDLTIGLTTKYSDIHSLKFLGALVQSNLKWQHHIAKVAASVAKGVFMIRALRLNVTTDVLISVYYAYIHSFMNYGVSLWGNSSQSKQIFILQKRAIRLICGVPSRTHCRPLFIRLGILSLPSMYVLSTLLYIKQNLGHIIRVSDIHSYETRHRHNLVTNRCNFTSTQQSFQYVGSRLFNALPIEIRKLPCKNFKRSIKSKLTNVCLYSVEEFFDISFS